MRHEGRNDVPGSVWDHGDCAQSFCDTLGGHLNKLGTNREQIGNRLPKDRDDICRTTHT